MSITTIYTPWKGEPQPSKIVCVAEQLINGFYAKNNGASTQMALRRATELTTLASPVWADHYGICLKHLRLLSLMDLSSSHLACLNSSRFCSCSFPFRPGCPDLVVAPVAGSSPLTQLPSGHCRIACRHYMVYQRLGHGICWPCCQYAVVDIPFRPRRSVCVCPKH